MSKCKYCEKEHLNENTGCNDYNSGNYNSGYCNSEEEEGYDTKHCPNCNLEFLGIGFDNECPECETKWQTKGKEGKWYHIIKDGKEISKDEQEMECFDQARQEVIEEIKKLECPKNTTADYQNGWKALQDIINSNLRYKK